MNNLEETILETAKISGSLSNLSNNSMLSSNCQWWPGYPTYYPSYVYKDTTAKAIEVIKLLEADGLVEEIKDVKRFIRLVEKIAKVL